MVRRIRDASEIRASVIVAYTVHPRQHQPMRVGCMASYVDFDTKRLLIMSVSASLRRCACNG